MTEVFTNPWEQAAFHGSPPRSPSPPGSPSFRGLPEAFPRPGSPNGTLKAPLLDAPFPGGASPSAGAVVARLPPPGFFKWGGVPDYEGDLDAGRFLCEIRHLSLADLVAEVALEEENLRSQANARHEMEALLRAELERLQSEIRWLRREGAAAKREAERAAAAAETVKHHNNAELKALCRKLDATQRGTMVTRRMASQTVKFQEAAAKAREELCKHLGVLPQRRNEYESASQTLEFMAMRVKSLEQEKADINAADDDEDSMLGQEAKALLTAKTGLIKEMNGIRDVMDLKYLLDMERANAEGRRIGNARLVEEVAEMEREAEILDRTNQQAVLSLRNLLERGAAREKELEHGKTKAAQWLKCVWEAMCKQRKDELALLEKAKQDDVWTEHLQQRVDNLIVELRQLEADALAFGTGPNPLPAEEELEERHQRSMVSARQLRRGAQHALATHVTKHEPLVQALAAAEEEERHLSRQLRSVRDLLYDRAHSRARPP